MRPVQALVGFLSLLCAGSALGQGHDHTVAPRKASPTGYKAEKAVTRYELAAALYQIATRVEAALKQPARTERERKPGRPGTLVPDTKKVRAYSDVPRTHWAAESLAGLQARGLTLVSGKSFDGERVMTGNEIAVWVDGLAGWTEGRAAKARQLQDLVRAGYLSQASPLVKKATKPLTAREVSGLLTEVVVRSQEKITTITPESLHGNR